MRAGRDRRACGHRYGSDLPRPSDRGPEPVGKRTIADAYDRSAAGFAAAAEHLPFPDDSFAVAVCAFGINHFPDAGAAVAEMVRVAPAVGVVTWRRPAVPYVPKQVVLEVIARHAGRARSDTGVFLDSLGDRIGSRGAVAALLSGAGLRPDVKEETVVVPWLGIEAFLDYRLAMVSTAALVADVDKLRDDAFAALATVPESELEWQAQLVVGVGRRRTITDLDQRWRSP